MSGNSFGQHFVITTFGESHGPALGVVIDGMPAQVIYQETLLHTQLARRRPGTSAWVSPRQEADHPEVLSGIYQGKTLGTPIGVIVRNQDAQSQAYDRLGPRVGHADDVWLAKYGHSDLRGGGRTSGRETLARVIGGAFAQMYVQQQAATTKVLSFAQQIGPFILDPQEYQSACQVSSQQDLDQFPARFPSPQHAEAVEKLLVDAKAQGKSYGGRGAVVINSPPANLGRPVFHKLKADLAAAYFSIGATMGIELGAGQLVAGQEGSEFHRQQNSDYGGIRGGISTGERITWSVAFKPTATVLSAATQGRHDPCIVPRALVVLEAMSWLVLADHLLASRLDCLSWGGINGD